MADMNPGGGKPPKAKPLDGAAQPAKAKPSMDYAADVRRYAPNAGDKAVAAIVKHCGIALRNKDSSLVSGSDKVECDRVRENWLKKKLGLTDDDATLDKSIREVADAMKADRNKQRVTFYYLLAEKHGKVDELAGA